MWRLGTDPILAAFTGKARHLAEVLTTESFVLVIVFPLSRFLPAPHERPGSVRENTVDYRDISKSRVLASHELYLNVC